MPTSDQNNIPAARAAIDAAVTKALAETGEKTVERITKGFDSSSDALGRPWTPNAPSTVRQKGFNRPLYRFGNLQESFKSKVDGDSVEIFSEDPNLARNEFGESGVPPRPVMQPAAIWLEQNALKDSFSSQLKSSLSDVEL